VLLACAGRALSFGIWIVSFTLEMRSMCHIYTYRTLLLKCSDRIAMERFESEFPRPRFDPAAVPSQPYMREIK